MTNTQRLLEALRDETPPHTWYAVAAALEMPDSSIIYKYVNHPKTLPIEYAYRLATLLDLDRAGVVALVEADAAKTADKRDFWMKHAGKLATKFRGAAMVTLAIGAGFLGVSATSPSAEASTNSMYYGKL